METCDDCGRAFEPVDGVTDGSLKRCFFCASGERGIGWEPIDEYEKKDKRRKRRDRFYGGGF